jgi:hypothetical protein
MLKVGYFFKIVLFRSLTFTVAFGLWHGLCTLPVLLSLLPVNNTAVTGIAVEASKADDVESVDGATGGTVRRHLTTITAV